MSSFLIGKNSPKKSLFFTVCAVSLLSQNILPRNAHALSPDARTVLVAGAYGLVGGTLLGLTTLPLNQNARTVFIGTSIGLYLGLAVGIYFVYDRHHSKHALSDLSPSAPIELAEADQLLRARVQTRGITGFESVLGENTSMRLVLPVWTF